MGTSLSYHCSITRCLSKLQGALLWILSTFSLLSNTNSRMWSPALLTSKPFFDRHRGLNVLMTASTLNALFVRNFAAIIHSLDDLSSDISRFTSSLSFNERFCQCSARLSHLYFLTNTRVSLVDYNKEEKKRLKRPTGDNSYLRYNEILTQGMTILLCKVSFSGTPGRANLTKRNLAILQNP